jgi:hypothetical protein
MLGRLHFRVRAGILSRGENQLHASSPALARNAGEPLMRALHVAKTTIHAICSWKSIDSELAV